MKKSVPLFRKYLDVLGETLKYAEASRQMRLDPCTIFYWIKESKANAAIERPDQPSEFCFEHGGEIRWLHEHVRNVITISVEEIEAAARSRALHGTSAVARFQGATVWRRDPALIGRPELIELLGLPDDLMRGDDGLPMPEMIFTAPSTDLVAMVLQAHSRIYRRQSSVSVDLNAKISGGVMVVGGPQQKPQAQLPLPILEIISEAEEEPRRTEAQPFEDIDSDARDDFDDADDVAPEQVDTEYPPSEKPRPPTTTARPVRQSTAPNGAVEPYGSTPRPPVVDGARPSTIKAPPAPMAPGPNPMVHRNADSALVRDLLSRMRGPAAVRSAPVSTDSQDDYDSDRTGPGEPPRGTKIS